MRPMPRTVVAAKGQGIPAFLVFDVLVCCSAPLKQIAALFHVDLLVGYIVEDEDPVAMFTGFNLVIDVPHDTAAVIALQLLHHLVEMMVVYALEGIARARARPSSWDRTSIANFDMNGKVWGLVGRHDVQSCGRAGGCASSTLNHYCCWNAIVMRPDRRCKDPLAGAMPGKAAVAWVTLYAMDTELVTGVHIGAMNGLHQLTICECAGDRSNFPMQYDDSARLIC